jgi:predicted metalloprotease with PDZ domain
MRLHATLILFATLLSPFSASSQTGGPIQLRIDMTDASRHLVHVHETLPVHPGDNVFEYPQWIPGEHGPNGPIDAVADIHFFTGTNDLTWRRDLVDLYALHVNVPPGTSQIDLNFDFLGVEGLFYGINAMSYGGLSSHLAMLEMSSLILYPADHPVHDIAVTLSLHLPDGWHYGTALRPTEQHGPDIRFAQVSVEQLIDSPIVMGDRCKQFPLAPEVTPKHSLDVCADTDADLALKPETLDKFSNLVREAGTLYRSHHYDHYDFVLALSSHIAGDSLEHHQSADYRVASLDMTKLEGRLSLGYLFPHEYSHSWCGKYRRPIGLATPDYKTPMHDDLLWVYEGLDQYLGWLLSVRSGFWTPQDFLDGLTPRLATLDRQSGRTWRNMQDTADASSFLRGGDSAWHNWRRGQEYYEEGALVWLETDVKIRQLTQNRKSIDDFAALFFGKEGDTTWKVVPYTFQDVVRDLNAIAPFDWAAFWTERLNSHAPRAPLAGLEGAGYKLVEREEMSPLEQNMLGTRTDMHSPLGFLVDDKGIMYDVTYTSPAFAAGFGPMDRITAVNGTPFSSAVLRKAVQDAKNTTSPILFTVLREGESINLRIDYHQGERYPWIVRDDSHPDLFLDILKPRAPISPASPATKANGTATMNRFR